MCIRDSIQGITGDKETPPPVHFPEDSEMQPAVGYPVPVRDDGNISLPLIQPIRVEGLTLGQAETRIRNAYTRDREILQEGNEKIIVTLMKRRTVNVLVIREDASDNRTFTQRSNETFIDDQKQGQTFSLDLPIYKNDVLHALSETGGMPSEGAVNEIVILRDGMNQMNQQAGLITDAHGEASGGAGSVVRIPIEGSIDQFPDLTEEDITLNEGDIVYIEGRDRDVFYTGGLLEGGRFPIPRDYEIDVLEAMSLSGGSALSTAGASTGGFRSGNVVPATKVLIFRKQDCRTCAIEVDLRCAQSDPSQRVIIQPGDMIVLEYRPREIFINTAVSILSFGGLSAITN